MSFSVNALRKLSAPNIVYKASCIQAAPRGFRAASRRFQLLKAFDARAMASAGASEDFYKHGMKPLTKDGKMSDVLERLGVVKVDPEIGSSKYIKTQAVMYELDGQQRKWDMIVSYPSVGIVIHHTTLDAFLMVRQFRPAVYATLCTEAAEKGQPKPPLSVGFCYELCAGLVDKNKSLEEIAREEVLEECGFDVPVESIEAVTTYHSAIGTSGSRHSVFTVEVDESMRVSGGGGIDGEAIEVLSLPLDQSDAFIKDTTISKSAGVCFGLLWLKERIATHQRDLAFNTRSMS